MASIIDPRITSIPSPTPTRVGQLVPEFGREAAGVPVPVSGVVVEVPPHVQLVLLVQLGFLQKP